MQRRLRYLLFVLLVGVAARVQVVRAQSLELTWQAPAACPNAMAMRARIADMIANSEVSAGAVTAVGRIEGRDGRWRLRLLLDLRGHHAVRELEDADCASLSETAAWLVSVAIDPNLPPPPRVESAPNEPTPVPEAGAEQPIEAPDHAAEEEDSDATATTPLLLRWRFGIFGGAFAAGFAGLAGSVGAEAGIELNRFSVALFGAHHVQRSRALDAPGTRADFSSLELGLAGCIQWGDELRVGPCALVSGLRTQGGTQGVTDAEDAALFWATAGASIGVRYVVSAPIELMLDAGLWVPVSARPRFEVEPLGTAGRAARVGGRFRLGVGLRLP